MNNIGEKIKLKRLEKKWTQEELATRMGYKTKSTITKIENGINDVSQKKVVKFAEVLGVSVAYLMGWENSHEWFKTFRTEKNISLMEIADEFNISIEDLKAYEKGMKSIPFHTLKRIADFYGVKMGFFDYENENEVNTVFQASRWNAEVGVTNFTDAEMTELINFAKYLISKRNVEK